MIAILSLALLPVLSTQELASAAEPVAPLTPEPTDAWVDVDADGSSDLVLTLPGGGVRVLRNAGEAGFEDVTDLVGHEVLAHTRQATWADIEGDGDLDLVAVQFGGAVALLRNEGGAVFARADAGSGLETITGALSASWNDFDDDGAPDLLLRTVKGYVLEHNTGLGIFEPRLSEVAPASTPPMGTGGSEQVTGEPGPNGPRAASVGIDSREDVGDAATRSVTGSAGRPTPEDRGETGMVGGPGSGPASTVAPAPVLHTVGPAEKLLACQPWISDASTGSCVQADSTPTLGRLYPLGPELFIDSASGFVGMGTLSPSYALEVVGQVVSGTGNTASGLESAVGGGKDNSALGERATIGGGEENVASGWEAVIGGGLSNEATGAQPTVGGGWRNEATGHWSTVGGGNDNTASGQGSCVPGGLLNEASGSTSFAAGRAALALHDGAFVWADDNPGAFASTAADQFLIRAAGGVGIGTSAPLAALHVVEDSTTRGGLRVEVTDPTSALHGIRSINQGQGGVGISGRAMNPNGLNIGVYGHSESLAGFGGFFRNAVGGFAGYFEGIVEAYGSIRSNGPGASVACSNPNNSAVAASLDWLNDVARIRVSGFGPGSTGGLDIQTTGDTSLMRLQHDGKIGIGMTNPDLRVHIEGGTDVGPTGGGYLQCGSTSGDNVAMDSNEIMARHNGAVDTLNLNVEGGNIILGGTGTTGSVGIGDATPSEKLDVAGKVRCTSLIETSDARYKRDVRELEDALEAVLALRGVSYEWNPETFERGGPGRRLGFLAQEVRDVLPDAVSEDAEGMLAVSYTSVVPLLVEALRELTRRDEETDREVEALGRENAEMRSRIEALEAVVAKSLD